MQPYSCILFIFYIQGKVIDFKFSRKRLTDWRNSRKAVCEFSQSFNQKEDVKSSDFEDQSADSESVYNFAADNVIYPSLTTGSRPTFSNALQQRYVLSSDSIIENQGERFIDNKGGDQDKMYLSLNDSYIEKEPFETVIFQKEIKIWSLKHNCTRQCTNDLLTILNRHGHQEMPKDARTLLCTRRVVKTASLRNGNYIYFGIKQGIENILQFQDFNSTKINLICNVDGLPLFKSSAYQVWPILCQFGYFKPFVVGLYGGKIKPCASELLADFAEELKTFKQPEEILGKIFNISLFAITCDAPGRALLKGTIEHSGYYACERCNLSGFSIHGRIVYDKCQETVTNRNNADLKAGLYSQKDNDGRCHLHTRTPLFDVEDLDMIQDFALDYMHLVNLGVMRRMLYYYKVSNMLHPKERVPSPNLHALSCTTSGSSSPNQLDVPLLSLWKRSKSKMGCVVQLRSNEDSQQSDLESYHFTKSSTSFKIGDGGVSFKEMTNKQFQYAMLMKLDSLQQNQVKIMERLENLETHPKSDTIDLGAIIAIPHGDIGCFNNEEENLRASSSARKNKITQIKAVGGATARKTVKNVLNQLMVPQVQNLFSKDGLKGKLKFTATQHYNCIKEGLVSERTGYDAANIEALVGDLLKRALPKVKTISNVDVHEEEAT
nr:uncharacterized protein LOC124816643 [Hydra vulgaris]